jgi:hypothetical protein
LVELAPFGILCQEKSGNPSAQRLTNRPRKKVDRLEWFAAFINHLAKNALKRSSTSFSFIARKQKKSLFYFQLCRGGSGLFTK